MKFTCDHIQLASKPVCQSVSQPAISIWITFISGFRRPSSSFMQCMHVLYIIYHMVHTYIHVLPTSSVPCCLHIGKRNNAQEGVVEGTR